MSRFALLVVLAALPALAQDCTFTLNPTTLSVSAAESTATITVTASRSNCARTAASTVPWITISFGQQGTGNGTVGIRVDDNKDPRSRFGAITVGGAAVTVTQAAANCAFTISPNSALIGAQGGNGTFSVTTTCNWRAETGNDWITASGNGTGNGTVTYTVSANTTGTQRIGVINVGSQQFRITQTAATCSQTAAPTNINLPAAGGSGSIAVTSGACAWTATTQANWITITSGGSGNGNGTVNYSAQPNSTAQPRTAEIRIGSAIVSITQSGNACSATLTPTSATFGSTGGSGAIAVTAPANCPTTATTPDSWISLTVTPNNIAYSVAANTSPSSRTGTIFVNGVAFTVTQGPAGCSVTLSPSSATVPAGGGSGNFLVAGQLGCRWLVATAAEWVSLNLSSGESNGTIIYTVQANDSGAARSASINVGNQIFTLTQQAQLPTFTAAGILNAASFTGGSVAPGLIVTIFGSALGPANLAVAQPDPQLNAFPTQTGGTQVLFDGVPAPMLYSSAGQLGAVVPYAAAGRTITRVEVVTQGVTRSAAISMPVAAVAPGIFTRSAQGSGPGAIINQDFSINHPENPASPGSIVAIYATGGGVLNPPAIDGRISDTVSSIQTQVTVEIDNRPAEVLYSGGAPALIHGVIQINARIHADARSGELPLRVRFGSIESQPGVTVSVK